MTEPYYADDTVTLYLGAALDVLSRLPDRSVNCCITSPPYFGLRDYKTPATDWPAVEFEPMAGLPPVTVPAMTAHLGLEPDPWAYVAHLVLIFAEVRRTLADDGTLWLNIGDSYSGGGNAGGGKRGHGAARPRRNTAGHYDRCGIGPKNLLGIPWRVAFALQATGWVLRKDVVWHKPNAMPESVVDRPSSSKEYLFLFSKGPRYWFNLDAIKQPLAYPELADGSRVFGGVNKGSAAGVDATARRRGGSSWGARPDPTNYPGGVPPQPRRAATGGRHLATSDGRNPGDVWSIATQPFPEAHFAVMAPDLADKCAAAGCPPGGTVLDPFSGVGTTGMVAGRRGCRYIGVDLSRESLDLSLRTRLAQAPLLAADHG